MSLVLDIPDDVVAALPCQDGEEGPMLLVELACALYGREILSMGKAAELAGLSRFDFGVELGRRGIARVYGEAELAADLAYASGQ
jgi:predicted HTH domain antitoxin